MKILRDWKLEQKHRHGLDLRVEERHLLSIRVLEEDLIRVTLLKDSAYRLARTWAIAPAEDVPWEGRNRESLEGFSCPDFELDESEELSFSTRHLRLTVRHPLALKWQCRTTPEAPWKDLAEDRPTAAYMLGRRDHRNAHFLRRFEGERVYGLGEKAGRLERSGRRFEMRNLDALGYDARTTDPLYKHIPFTITECPGAGAMGLFYDTLATCWFDLGNEVDNYHPLFRAFRASDGDLQYYLSWAPNILDVVKRQHWLTGGTAFMPRWGLGYSGSSMAYTDAPDGQAQVLGFLRRIAEEDIPCDSFQMSSGYTSINDKRYVFNWNNERFPDAPAMGKAFAAAEVHLIANIKPVMLDDHPRYGEAKTLGLFIRDSETGEAEVSAFWDGQGSHLDFTNPDTVKWWQANVTSQLLENGIGSTWNDNNEYEVWDDAACCAGFGQPIDVSLIRPLHGLLMTRASHEAQVARDPARRPYLISRCAAPGTQRYAQTWTGDNRTDWDTLRWNIPMGLGLSLSGIYNIGHDVGGFAGRKPEPELFLRWVQNGIFHPRFTIHSWNDDGSVNEAWMYPEITPLVRDAIKLRYRLLPYLYSLLYQAVTEGEPMLRPLFLDHPADPNCRDREFDFLLGRDLLVANVVEEGASQRRVYLPDCPEGWWDFAGRQWHPGGTDLALPVELASIPLFVRGGAVLALAGETARAGAAHDRVRSFRVYPQPKTAGESRSLLYDDDGTSADAPAGRHSLTRLSLLWRDDQLYLDWQRSGSWRPAFEEVTIEVAGKTPVQVRGAACEDGDRVAFGEG